MNINDLKEMKKKLAALSVAGTMAASAVGFGVAEVYADETTPEGIKTEEETDYSYTSEITTDKEKVENWLEEKENILKDDYEITEKKIVEVENQVISTEEKEINEREIFKERQKKKNNEEIKD